MDEEIKKVYNWIHRMHSYFKAIESHVTHSLNDWAEKDRINFDLNKELQKLLVLSDIVNSLSIKANRS